MTAKQKSIAKARREGEGWAKARQSRVRAIAYARDNFDWADERDAFLAGFLAGFVAPALTDAHEVTRRLARAFGRDIALHV